MFSCEFCEIFKITFSTEHLRATTSVHIYHLEDVKNIHNPLCGTDSIFLLRSIWIYFAAPNIPSVFFLYNI